MNNLVSAAIACEVVFGMLVKAEFEVEHTWEGLGLKGGFLRFLQESALGHEVITAAMEETQLRMQTIYL